MLGYFWGVDDRARLRLTVRGGKSEATLVLEVDTGSSEELFLSEDHADQLGIELETRHWATLADGSAKPVMKGAATVIWFDAEKPIEITVWPRSGSPKSPSRDKARVDGLIGRRLLKSSRLIIDYANRTISIETPPQSA